MGSVEEVMNHRLISMQIDGTTRFPFVLHTVLEDATAFNFERIISWVPNSDRYFIIHKPKEFAQFIMKLYFTNQNHYKSFLRQLNLYGFERIASKSSYPTTAPHGAYSHPLFRRGNSDLCFLMDRTKARRNRLDTPNSTCHLVEWSSQQAFGQQAASATQSACSDGSVSYPTQCCLVDMPADIPDELVDDIIEVFGRGIASNTYDLVAELFV